MYVPWYNLAFSAVNHGLLDTKRLWGSDTKRRGCCLLDLVATALSAHRPRNCSAPSGEAMAASSSLPESVALQVGTMQLMQRERALLRANSMVDRCFDLCVTDFALTKSLRVGEQECLSTCVQKYLLLSSKVGSSFNDVLRNMDT